MYVLLIYILKLQLQTTHKNFKFYLLLFIKQTS